MRAFARPRLYVITLAGPNLTPILSVPPLRRGKRRPTLALVRSMG
jgi:hypothetical protein